MSNLSVSVIFPLPSGHFKTGAGKSLIFMLAAMMKPEKEMTCLITPLKSLSHQCEALLRQAGLPVTRLLADSDTPDKTEIGRVVSGEKPCRVLIFTPEKLARNTAFQEALRQLDQKGRLGLFVIDECHCIAEASRDYRPEYLDLGRMVRDVCIKPQFCALSAVATTEVVDIVSSRLQLSHHDTWFFRGRFEDPPDGKIVHRVEARPTKYDHEGVLREFATALLSLQLTPLPSLVYSCPLLLSIANSTFLTPACLPSSTYQHCVLCLSLRIHRPSRPRVPFYIFS